MLWAGLQLLWYTECQLYATFLVYLLVSNMVTVLSAAKYHEIHSNSHAAVERGGDAFRPLAELLSGVQLVDVVTENL